ncbi:Cysteine-rich membrane protein 2 [Spironucleus salmonicida]|uniref:Cysteine-rich membrane protein 2 n=1 Tax=Spironucleus salmonicida TaxID=348837 RepID=V6LQ21_9EUKA|nr:Cysteine-rich membrane protein 2 [Spironucleus salmonicida]|eukprot:EST45811.1 Cysteine-rich membrane protein 2 [Spironucleus salmonicida]
MRCHESKPYCETCSDSSTEAICLTCQPHYAIGTGQCDIDCYQIINSDGLCRHTSDCTDQLNCVDCAGNVNICRKCKAISLYPHDGKCISVSTCKKVNKNCSQCDRLNPNLCTKCINPYSLLNGNCILVHDCRRGESAILGCSECVQGGSQCAGCESEYLLVEQQCINCRSGNTLQEGCLKCSSNDVIKCAQCKIGFSLINGNCINCKVGSGAIKNCIECDTKNPLKCADCTAWFQVVNGGCSNCMIGETIIENCIQCDKNSAIRCSSCRQHYTLLAGVCIENSICQNTHPDCKECDEINPSKCKTCYATHILIGTKCINIQACKIGPDAVPNCLACDFRKPPYEPRRCGHCIEGYILVDETCVEENQCLINDVNCLKCNSNNPTICGKCINEQAPIVGQACQEPILKCIVENCKSCKLNSDTICEICDDTFQLVGDVCVSVFQCLQTITNCKECDPQNLSLCGQCANDYIKISNLCVKTSEICASLVSLKQTCLITDDKLTDDPQTYEFCSPNCAKCININNCMQCNPSFLLSSGKCVDNNRSSGMIIGIVSVVGLVLILSFLIAFFVCKRVLLVKVQQNVETIKVENIDSNAIQIGIQ